MCRARGDTCPIGVCWRRGALQVVVCAGKYTVGEFMTRAALQATGGAVRAGVVCYTTDDEVDRLLEAL